MTWVNDLEGFGEGEFFRKGIWEENRKWEKKLS
jgi:hypothetical protein